MNILVINWQDWRNINAGGAELNLFEIFSRLIEKGHKVILLCSRSKNQSRHEVLNGFEIYRIGKRYNFNFFVPSAMCAILRHKPVDVIIDDLNKIPFYSPLFTHKKVVPMLHHLFRTAIFRETNFAFASYVFLTERLIPYLYSKSNFIAVSKSSAEDLRKIGVKNEFYIVYNGTSLPAKIPEVERQKNLIAYVGRVRRYKSIDHFIKAVGIIKRTEDIEAMIVGDGEAKEDLVKLADRLNIKITFTGFISEEEKHRIYAMSRVIVQPSIKEGWGLTALEAQSCGTPVVCADSPGLNEVVLDGKTGYLYPYGNIAALAEKITDLLSNDRKWRDFSTAAKEWASNFSWDKSAAKMEEVLLKEVSKLRG